MRSNANAPAASDHHAPLNSATRRAAKQMVEQLEGRRLLAADPFDFRNAALVKPTSANFADAKSGPLNKGGAGLVSIFREYAHHVKQGGDRYQFTSQYADQYVVEGRKVLVTMRTRGSVDALVGDVREMGGNLVYRNKAARIVEAYVPINNVDDLAARREMLHVRPNLRPILKSRGVVANDAERSGKSEYVLPSFGVDGSGQKVGVISDSYDAFNVNDPSEVNTSVPTGDLPADVEVLFDVPLGTDEGRAMLELVHDIAPGADLAFHAVGNSLNTFADAVRNLREAGSTVIVDDIGFGNEPFFGEGVLDRAINDVVEDGATFFTATGNYGFAGYAKTADFVEDPDADGGRAVDFDDSRSVDTKLDVEFNNAGFLTFQWDNPFDGVVADVTADVDFFVYRQGTLIASGTDDNFATGVPIERIYVPEAGNFEVVIRLNSLEKGATAPTAFQFLTLDDGMFDSRTDVEYPGINTTSFGHVGATGAIAVAAVDNSASNAFGTARDLSSQDFSSGGPILRVFDANGNRLPEPEIIQAPLLSGIQGTNTSVQGFAPFFGTSASAPNVAAIAALLQEIDSDASPDEIREVLVESAKANPLNGAKAGTYDPQAGFGLVDAVLAASLLDGDVPTSSFAVPAIATGGSLGSVRVVFSEAVRGVDLGDFTLTRDGTNRNRFTGGETLTRAPGGRTYTIQNLTSATNTLGTYTIGLRATGTDIRDDDGTPAAGNIFSFDVTLRQPSGVRANKLDDGNILLRWNDTNRGEDGYRVQRSTDADFEENIRNFDLDENAEQFVDNDVDPGEMYHYRVRAQKGSRLGDVGRTRLMNSSTGEVFLNESEARLRGTFDTGTDDAAYFESLSYTGETDEDERANTATFASDDLAQGSYFVYTRYTASKQNATNATYQVLRGDRVVETVRVDQTKRGGGWVLLGKFASDPSQPLSIRLTSLGANGNVVADGMRFLPADEATISEYEKRRRQTQSED